MAAEVAPAEEASVEARGLDANAAVRADAIAEREGHDHKIALTNGRHGRTGRLDDPDGLVADAVVAVGSDAAPEPQVRPADAGEDDPDDGICRVMGDRVGDGLDRDVAGGVEDRSAHVR